MMKDEKRRIFYESIYKINMLMKLDIINIDLINLYNGSLLRVEIASKFQHSE